MSRAAEAKRQARLREEQEKRAREERRKQEIADAFIELDMTLHNANRETEAIPGHLKDSERALSVAVEKLKKRSFYPFRVSIADAVEHPNRYGAHIQRIEPLRTAFARILRHNKGKVGNGDLAGIAPFSLPPPHCRPFAGEARRRAALMRFMIESIPISNFRISTPTGEPTRLRSRGFRICPVDFTPQETTWRP